MPNAFEQFNRRMVEGSLRTHYQLLLNAIAAGNTKAAEHSHVGAGAMGAIKRSLLMPSLIPLREAMKNKPELSNFTALELPDNQGILELATGIIKPETEISSELVILRQVGIENLLK